VPKVLAPGIDLKGDGGYVVVAPSIHASGNAYQWDGIAGAKALLNPADPPAWLLEYITTAHNGSRAGSKAAPGPQKIPKGKRNDHLASLSGTMRKRGMSREAIEAALLEENRLRCDPPLPDAEVRRVAASVASYKPGDNGGARRAVGVDDWAKPEPIQGELPPVVAFSEDLLPVSFRPLVADVSERMQVPMDYPAVMMVLCSAGLVNRRATIQPKANDTAWVVVPNLWGGIIARPGLLKSPVIQAATRPAIRIQAEWRWEYEAALADYAREKEECELRHSAWRDQFKASTKGKNAPPERPGDAPVEPTLKRLVVNDATFEALHHTMSENPAGILVIRDELTGWWSTLDKPGREGERAFALEAWAGDSSFTVDRIGRGTIHVPHCCMSMLGGIQPGRLRSYLVDALKDGPSNDGLIQRFQLLVWPDTAPDWKYVDRTPDAESEKKAERVFRRLVEFDADNPARFRFAPDAQGLFVEWLTELEAKVRGDELHPALISHLSKYRSLMPSLALLFELADRLGFVGFEVSSLANSWNFVNLEHTRQAAAWCDYLESHARRVYSCVVAPQVRAARELAERIAKRQIRNKDGGHDWFAARDVYLKGWSGLDSPEAVKQAADVLQDAGWVRELSGESGPFGGRPSNRYEVNPGVWE
jgi:putative DNA primase/helicase